MTAEPKPASGGPGLPKGLALVVGGIRLVFFGCLGVITFKYENLFVVTLLGAALVIVGAIVFFVALARKK
jgi:hypothetical protein